MVYPWLSKFHRIPEYRTKFIYHHQPRSLYHVLNIYFFCRCVPNGVFLILPSLMNPYFLIANCAYSEYVGWYRQRCSIWGDILDWYSFRSHSASRANTDRLVVIVFSAAGLLNRTSCRPPAEDIAITPWRNLDRVKSQFPPQSQYLIPHANYITLHINLCIAGAPPSYREFFYFIARSLRSHQ